METTTKPLLPAHWELPDEFQKRIGQSVGRQRAMSVDGHLLLILHAPPQHGERTRSGKFFWRQPAGKWFSSDDNAKQQSDAGIIALQNHLKHYESLVEKLEHAEETAIVSSDYFSVLSQLTPLQRATRNMHQAIQEARESIPEDREIINLRDQAYRINRFAELLFQDTQHALEFVVAKRAEMQANASDQMADSAHRLNLLAAFFFPILTLSAVFGVNLASGLETAAPQPYPFLGIIAIGLLLGIFLKKFVIQKVSHLPKNGSAKQK